MKETGAYYVYVYIDPRNFEEFYYGKGKGSRKFAHLEDSSDSEKTGRIRAIQMAGLEPIIRVIAQGLSEREALLVEKTLLWKLGKWTTNIATGHFAEHFRPKDSYHRDVPGFDFKNGLYYYNVGECKQRNWDDYVKFGFISGGQGERWREAMTSFQSGDIFVAYLKGHGFVGVGKILEPAKKISAVVIKSKPMLTLPLKCKNMSDNSDSEEKSEYVAVVEWVKALPRDKAVWITAPKLFTSTHVRASLDNQKSTTEYLEKQFRISFLELLK